MNKWRLSLAPHKCAQITFSKSVNRNNEALDLVIYGESVPYENNPKFLGITFDRNMTFKKHFENLEKKIQDRLNILKILSYDKNWRLEESLLIKMYKVLVRSVLDYASVIYAACNKKVNEDFEIIQNNCLRIIFKKKMTDQIPIETLKSWANIGSIKERHEFLMHSYYEKTIISNNPLLKKTI